MTNFNKYFDRYSVLIGNVIGSGLFFLITIYATVVLDDKSFKAFIQNYGVFQAISNIGFFGMNSIYFRLVSIRESFSKSLFTIWLLNFICALSIVFFFYGQIKEVLEFLDLYLIIFAFIFGYLRLILIDRISKGSLKNFVVENIFIRLLISSWFIYFATSFINEQHSQYLLLAFIFSSILGYYYIVNRSVLTLNFSSFKSDFKYIYRLSLPWLVLALANLGSGHMLNAYISELIASIDLKSFTILLQCSIVVPIVMNSIFDQRAVEIYKKLDSGLSIFKIDEILFLRNPILVLLLINIVIGLIIFYSLSSFIFLSIILLFQVVVTLMSTKSVVTSLYIQRNENWRYIVVTIVYNLLLFLGFYAVDNPVSGNTALVLYTSITLLHYLLLVIFLKFNNEKNF